MVNIQISFVLVKVEPTSSSRLKSESMSFGLPISILSATSMRFVNLTSWRLSKDQLDLLFTEHGVSQELKILAVLFLV